MKQKLGAFLGVAVLIVFFQNCSNSNVGFDPGTATAASTSTPDTDTSDPATSVTPTTSTTPAGGDVLNSYNFTDITKVSFSGVLNLYWAGNYSTTADLTLDHAQHSFDGNLRASGLYLWSPITCHSQGTVSDYNNLESGLQNISFNITHSAVAYDFVSATLKIYLKTGVIKSYVIDTSVTSISVDNATHIDAKALKVLMKALLFNAGCSY